MKGLRKYLSEQGLTEFIDDIDVLEAKCRSMDQHIRYLENKVNDIRLRVAEKAMQGLLSCEAENFNASPKETAISALEHADALLEALSQSDPDADSLRDDARQACYEKGLNPDYFV